MPLISRNEYDAYSIALWNVDEDEGTLLSMISNRDEYSDELQKIKSAFRRKEWLAVRVLLDSMAKGEKIEYRASGSPYLKSGNYNISISHTASFVSIILSKDKRVAIDIEKYGERVAKVISKFVSEYEQITSYRGNEFWSMLLHWSAKETAFKMIDTQNVDLKKDLLIYPFVVAEKGELLLKEKKSDKQEILLIYYQLFDSFVMTWTVK